MTNLHLTLDGVSCTLPDGRQLFPALSETIDQRPTGLVGRNGVGKTMLARILAGQLQPTSGRCSRSGNAYYLEQTSLPAATADVASLAGVHHILHALERIEAGSCTAGDFDIVGYRWDIRQRLMHALQIHGLGHLDVHTTAATLSGGEAMRVRLIGALLSDADFLILDEPSNNLDRASRRALLDELQHWPRGLLVISHDRQLLNAMQRILELSALGLRSYGGNHATYVEQKEQEHRNALRQLEERKLERDREQRAMREQQQRQERRVARGSQRGRQANQAKILLDRQKERSEGSTGRLKKQHAELSERLSNRVMEAAKHVAPDISIHIQAPLDTKSRGGRVAGLDGAILPFLTGPTRHIDLHIGGQQRVGIVGPNGCGKSILLKVLAGKLRVVQGTCAVTLERSYLDQLRAGLPPACSALDSVRANNRLLSDSDLRMRLAQIGLEAQQIVIPSERLSGGERLKAALASILYADTTPRLLLLDEPDNHLDLPSLNALELMLQSYRGALLIASHDDMFLDRLALTHRLHATQTGWSMTPW